MTDSLPKVLKDLLGLLFTIEPIDFEDCGKCSHYKTKRIPLAIQNLHTRPLYVISSNKFGTLEDVKEQLSEWFDDGTLESVAAVYRVSDDVGSFYVISATEFDTSKEANEQLLEWHNEGKLHRKARVYKSDLANTYEIKLGLVKASLF